MRKLRLSKETEFFYARNLRLTKYRTGGVFFIDNRKNRLIFF